MTGTPDLRPLVDELVSDGADVVWLAGSFARGDAGPYSDVDIGALTRTSKRGRSFRMYADRLTSIVWTTEAATRSSFGDPGQVGGAIPGWRKALLLHDPQAIGSELQHVALAWTWDSISEVCDRWVAAQFLQLCEEVHKLLNALSAGHQMNSAIRRKVIVQRLPLVLSVHRRILYDSEANLWDAVAEALGRTWQGHQRAALALDGVSLSVSVSAALTMYEMATAELHQVFVTDQLAVVDSTVALVREYTDAVISRGAQ